MTTKAKPTSGVDDNGLRWEDVPYGDTTYRLREITVDESDAAFDAAQNPDKTFNARLNQRMLLVSSIMSPATALDDIGKWGGLKYLVLLRAFDRLNTLPPADAEGNA